MIQKYKVVPPDGGYGYVIVLAVVIINIANMTFAQSYGILFQSFYAELDMSTTNILIQFSLNVITLSISGFATGPLIKIFSGRQITILGSAFASLGSFGIVFAQSEIVLNMCSSLQSMGSGFLINTSFTAINDYFVAKRWLFLTLSQVCPAITSMLAPLFLHWSLEFYGQRSTLLLIAGVNMQTMVAACLLQPVAWHMRRVPIENVPEKEALMSTSLDTKSSLKVYEEIQNDVMTLKISIAESLGPPLDAKEEKLTVEKRNGDLDDSSKQSVFSKIFNHIFDVEILKNFIIMNACLGIAICVFAHSAYTLLLPIALETEDKWDKETVAWAIALLCFGDIATRIVMLVFNKFFTKIPTRVVFIIGTVIAVVSRLGQLWWVNKTVVMCFITLAGVSQCTVLTLMPHIIGELTDPRQFSAAMGTLMMLLGLVSIVFGPVIGKIRDLSKSYLTVFYILTSFFAIVALFWCIEMCYVSNQRKEKERLKKGAPKRIVKTTKRSNKRR